MTTDGSRVALEQAGTLEGVKAQIRADLCSALENCDQDDPSDVLSRENLIINELLREYLSFNGYGQTLATLLPEAGQPEAAPFSREQLAQRLGLREDAHTQKLPLMYSILAQCLERAEQGSADKDRLLRKMTLFDL
eukprot:jgi/Botrbrau1/10248/Bobra.0140s0005.1